MALAGKMKTLSEFAACLMAFVHIRFVLPVHYPLAAGARTVAAEDIEASYLLV